MNYKYCKNIEGKFGFYKNGGLSNPEEIIKDYKELQTKLAEVEKERDILKEGISVAMKYLNPDNWNRSFLELEQALEKIKGNKNV